MKEVNRWRKWTQLISQAVYLNECCEETVVKKVAPDVSSLGFDLFVAIYVTPAALLFLKI